MKNRGEGYRLWLTRFPSDHLSRAQPRDRELTFSLQHSNLQTFQRANAQFASRMHLRDGLYSTLYIVIPLISLG